MTVHAGVALLVVAVLSACGGQTPSAGPTATPQDDAAPGQATDTATSCDSIERPPTQGGSHLLGDRSPPVPYSSTPPTSGWHVSGAVPIGVHDAAEPLSEPLQVSVLEAGGVVVTYRALPDEERTRLEEHVGRQHDGRVAVTPYDRLGRGEVAFTAWGVVQRCSGVDLGALDAFVDEHADAVSGPAEAH